MMKQCRPLLNIMIWALAIATPLTLGASTYAATAKSTSTTSKSGSQKNLNFDGDYVELMNKNPLDSLTELSEADKNRKNAHLYRKRADFVPETSDTLQQVRFQ